MGLLSQAKAVQIRISRPRSNTKLPRGQEAEELALAWLQGDVRAIQVISTIGCKPGSAIYAWFAQRLRDAHKRGALKVRVSHK